MKTNSSKECNLDKLEKVNKIRAGRKWFLTKSVFTASTILVFSSGLLKISDAIVLAYLGAGATFIGFYNITNVCSEYIKINENKPLDKSE